MHIRKDPPTKDPVIQALTPPWKAVRGVITVSHSLQLPPELLLLSASHGEPHWYSRRVPTIQHCRPQGQRLGTTTQPAGLAGECIDPLLVDNFIAWTAK